MSVLNLQDCNPYGKDAGPRQTGIKLHNPFHDSSHGRGIKIILQIMTYAITVSKEFQNHKYIKNNRLAKPEQSGDG